MAAPGALSVAAAPTNATAVSISSSSENTWMAPAARNAASQTSTLPATAPGVRRDGLLALGGAAALEHDHRLAEGAGAAACRDERSRLPQLLQEHDNGLDGRLLDQGPR